jgi:type I restriction enzyme S subunit
MNENWLPVKLADVLTPTSRGEVVDAQKEYSLLGIRLDGNGAFLRETILGSQTSAKKLFQVSTGDFIYSRLYACNGAFSVIREDLDGCYVSNEFPAFIPINDQVDVDFLRYWFRLPNVLAEVNKNCEGSTPLTRNRYKEKFFLDLDILLPPLEEQRRIVERIEELETAIDEAQGLQEKSVSEINLLLQASKRNLIGEKPDQTWVTLDHYVERIENGKSPACEARQSNIDEWGVLKVGVVSFGTYNPNENKALPSTMTPSTQCEVRAGDFLMSRANTRDLVGMCAVVNQTRPKLLLSDKIFRFIFKTEKKVDPHYLDYVLKSPALREQIEKAATGTSQTMKNISKEKVLNLLIPCISLSEQRRIVTYLDDLQAKIDSLKRLQAETAAELDALLPSILDKAFKGQL